MAGGYKAGFLGKEAGRRGPNERRHPRVLAIDFEALIRADHPLRPIKARVDEELTRWDAVFEAAYSDTGRPSGPSEVLLKALLLPAWYSIRSERQLVERLTTDRLFRWFCDPGPAQEVFDPSAFSPNRERLAGHGVSAAFFDGVVRRAREAGLTSDEPFTVDGTLIQSHASLKSLEPEAAQNSASNRPDGEGGTGGGGGCGRGRGTAAAGVGPAGRGVGEIPAGAHELGGRQGLCIRRVPGRLGGAGAAAARGLAAGADQGAKRGPPAAANEAATPQDAGLRHPPTPTQDDRRSLRPDQDRGRPGPDPVGGPLEANTADAEGRRGLQPGAHEKLGLHLKPPAAAGPPPNINFHPPPSPAPPPKHPFPS